MTSTEPTQTTSTQPANDAARDEAKCILNEAQDAMSEIEIGIDRINDLMVELLSSGDLSEEAQALADNLGTEANELFNALDDRVEALRKEIAASDDAAAAA